MKTKISTILMVAALIISTAAAAQKSMSPKNKKYGQEMAEYRMKPDFQKTDFLTEEQKEAFKKLRLETAKELKPLKNELRELMAHQQTLATADNADLKAINKNIDKMSEVKADIAKIMARQHQAFRSQLNEEQLIIFDSRQHKMHPVNQNQKNKREYGERPMRNNRI